MTVLSGEVSKEDQVIERYYYYIFSDSFSKKKNKIFFAGLLGIIIFSMAFFYLRGESVFLVFLLLPLIVPAYFCFPWLYWKHSIPPMWKKIYSAFNREIFVSGDIIVINSGNEHKKNIKPSSIDKVLYNSRHLVLFHGDNVDLISVDSAREDDLDKCVEQLRVCCENATIGKAKIKQNLL